MAHRPDLFPRSRRPAGDACGRASRNERLRQIIKELQRHRFGRRAESLPADQLLLALEEVEQTQAAAGGGEEAGARQAGEPDPTAPRQPRLAAGPSAPHPEILDVAEKTCPCCRAPLHPIGEDVSERLDKVPAQFRVIATRRPKYACRACEEVVVQAPAPARLMEGGIPTEAMVAHVLVSKYADHLPLYRQAQIYARQGVDLDRSTLADWVGKAAFLLRPVHERLFESIEGLDEALRRRDNGAGARPGRGRTKTGQLWAYARDDRPWGGTDPPASSIFTRRIARRSSRSAPAGLRGNPPGRRLCRLQALAETNTVAWPFAGATCAGASTNSPRLVRRPSPARRWRVSPRSTRSRPISGAVLPRSAACSPGPSQPLVNALEPWLRDKLTLISQKTKLAEAIRYALTRWDGLCRFIDDGRVEIDSNIVERAIRPIALNRKNALFAGSDGGAEHWAAIASLIETCKLNAVEPHAYLTDVMTRIVAGHLKAGSTTCCHGPTRHRRSRPWPENSAYKEAGHGRFAWRMLAARNG